MPQCHRLNPFLLRSMIPEAVAAKDRFLQVRGQLIAIFERVPIDRQAWSPSPTARSPIAIVAHCAEAINNITQMIRGNRFGLTTVEADELFLANEARVATAQQAL